MIRNFSRVIRTTIIIFSLFCVLAFGHSGRTDSNGGHTNSKTGEYHSHNNGDDSDGSGAIVLGVMFVIIVFGVIVKGVIGDDK